MSNKDLNKARDYFIRKYLNNEFKQALSQGLKKYKKEIELEKQQKTTSQKKNK